MGFWHAWLFLIYYSVLVQYFRFLAIADSAPSSRSRDSLLYSSGGARGHGPYSIISASGFDWSLNFHGWKRPSLSVMRKYICCV